MAKLIVPQLRRQKHGADFFDFFAPVKMNRAMRRKQEALARAEKKK